MLYILKFIERSFFFIINLDNLVDTISIAIVPFHSETIGSSLEAVPSLETVPSVPSLETVPSVPSLETVPFHSENIKRK
jgi:hypothetical protein